MHTVIVHATKISELQNFRRKQESKISTVRKFYRIRQEKFQYQGV